uniref:Phosphoribosyltransferase domain-containing protein n=1 Tax=Pinguiococcus pyrenoidosus TaxID=172671 RepID=A0A7R9UGV9_9STRA|mmetsp:Transcript_7908/g.29584  ORF Transcript_7908/g.29584 Transcript_7908/m.29584 type:complete len:235 (+) Transcript_7908:418-1122(+)
MIVLLESFVESLTVVLPFYPVGTMERVTVEGQVATGSTYARMLSHLPLAARPTRLMVYDVHTLQNRFYLSSGVIASLCTTVPLVVPMFREVGVTCVAFPDDGAAKRFGTMFQGFPLVTCGKTRQGDERIVTINSGDCKGLDVCIVDDLVQTGGTLFEAGKALRDAGAKSVSAFVVHAVFPGEGWRRFLRGGDRAIFERFFLTNSNPTRVAEIPEGDTFVVVDITEKVLLDIDRF